MRFSLQLENKEGGSPLGFCLSALFYGILAALFVLLFAQNFVFSESMDLLSFHEVDDIAFQSTLRACHKALAAGSTSCLWSANEYAYGWLFWTPLTIVTYPLYFLSQKGIDWPLIVFPRQISLLFGFASLFLVERALRLLKTPIFERTISVLALALFPPFAFYCMLFGTVSELMFFSVLSVYGALRPEAATPKGRNCIALAAAAACGIKLSGVFVLPIVAALVWIKLEDRSVKGLVRALAGPILLFTLASVFFTNPELFLAPFHKSYAEKYFHTLSVFMQVPKTSFGDPVETRFFQGLFLGSWSYAVLWAGALSGSLAVLFRKDQDKVVFGILAFGFVLVAGYLVLSIKLIINLTSYIVPLLFALFMGIAGWSRFSKGWIVVLFLLCLIGSETVFWTIGNENPNFTARSLITYFAKEERLRPALQEAYAVKDCLLKDRGENSITHIFMDYTLPLTFNPVSMPQTCLSYAWGNLAPKRRYCEKPADYLILDTVNPPGTWSDERFNAQLQNMDATAADFYRDDRETRRILKETGRFGDQSFVPLCRIGDAQVYKAVAAPAN